MNLDCHISDPSGTSRVEATYGLNYDRLGEIKKTYDPSNLFRSNRNLALPTQDGLA